MDDRWLAFIGSLLAALLGGGLVNAVLSRQTGHENATNSMLATQLDQQTKRLDGEIDVLKALYDAAAKRLDKAEADLIIERAAHLQCEKDLTVEREQRQREVKHLGEEVVWMRRALQQRGINPDA